LFKSDEDTEPAHGYGSDSYWNPHLQAIKRIQLANHVFSEVIIVHCTGLRLSRSIRRSTKSLSFRGQFSFLMQVSSNIGSVEFFIVLTGIIRDGLFGGISRR
jgi:hypothetical protein